MGERLDDQALSLYRDARAWWLLSVAQEAVKVGAGEHNAGVALALYARLRAEHGVELYPAVELPDVGADGRETVRLVHPLGSVLGRATYAPGLVVYQGVSVGSTVDGERPVFKGPAVLFPGAKVLGNVTVGSNVWITAGTCVASWSGETVTVPDNVIVFPAVNPIMDSGALGCAWRKTERSVIERFFGEPAAAPDAAPGLTVKIVPLYGVRPPDAYYGSDV